MQGDIVLEEAELYANLSEKMRHFVEEYFHLKQPLYIAYTHLVCRTAYEDGTHLLVLFRIENKYIEAFVKERYIGRCGILGRPIDSFLCKPPG